MSTIAKCMGYQVNKLLQETCEEDRVYAELSMTGIHSVCTHKVYETLDKALTNLTPTPTPISDRPSEESNKTTKKSLPSSVTVSSVIDPVHHLTRPIQEWLESIGLGQYGASLVDQGYDRMSVIASMNETLVREMAAAVGMPPGHTTCLIIAQASLTGGATTAPAT